MEKTSPTKGKTNSHIIKIVNLHFIIAKIKKAQIEILKLMIKLKLMILLKNIIFPKQQAIIIFQELLFLTGYNKLMIY